MAILKWAHKYQVFLGKYLTAICFLLKTRYAMKSISIDELIISTDIRFIKTLLDITIPKK